MFQWVIEDVSFDRIVDIDGEDYFRFLDPHVNQKRWHSILKLVPLPLSCIWFDEVQRCVFIAVDELKETALNLPGRHFVPSGTSPVGCFLVITDKGQVLLDAGFESQMIEILRMKQTRLRLREMSEDVTKLTLVK